MYGDINDPVRLRWHVAGGGDALPCLAGPAGLDPISRDIAVIDQRIPHRIRTLMRQVHVVVGAADGVGLADDRRDRVGVLLQTSSSRRRQSARPGRRWCGCLLRIQYGTRSRRLQAARAAGSMRPWKAIVSGHSRQAGQSCPRRPDFAMRACGVTSASPFPVDFIGAFDPATVWTEIASELYNHLPNGNVKLGNYS